MSYNSRKSRTYYGKQTGKPVTEYDSLTAAEQGAEFAGERYGNDMTPYLCPTCGKWHLAPKQSIAAKETAAIASRKSTSRTCYGKQTGKLLAEYHSLTAAEQAAEFVGERYGNDMTPYLCPTCGKCHLAPKQNISARETAAINSIKSTSCFGRESGEAVTEYDSLEDAEDAADYANETFHSGSNNLSAYFCRECHHWHLSPRNRQTESSHWCGARCTGSNGQLKDAYANFYDANKRAEILTEERRISLYPYQCPFDAGSWHLTKKKNRLENEDFEGAC